MSDVFIQPSGEIDTSQQFFEVHKPTIQEVFAIMGAEDQWADDVTVVADQVKHWADGDHSRPGEKAPKGLTDEQLDALDERYERMGLTQERVLPIIGLDQVIVFGAIHRGNMRRLEYLERMRLAGIQVDKAVLLGGQRRPFEEREETEIKENIAEILTNKPDAPTWATEFLEKPLSERWETDLIRLAAYAKLGELAFKRLHLTMGDGEDAIDRYVFDWGGTPLIINHSRAVARHNGDKRHNTDSCVRDWIRSHDVPEDAHIGVIAAQPHLDRMARATARVLREEGREDVILFPGGPAIPTLLRGTIPLGEMSRHFYEDTQLAA